VIRTWLPCALAVALGCSACGSSPATSTTPRPSAAVSATATAQGTLAPASPAVSATPDACAAPAATPLPASIPANFATAMAFAPDGRLFFAERGGTIRVWQGGSATTFATVNTVTTEPGGGYSERGLLGLAVDPHFSKNRYVYAFYSDANRTQQKLIRWRDCGGVGGDATVLITFPAGSDCCHKGGRIAFGTDGMLYVTLGDEHTAAAAQNTSDVRGKVLRYRADGSIPSDNPFGPTDPVWAYGFRNPFGIAVAANGQIAVTSNGPSGDAGSPSTGYDTLVSSVARGGSYQWPYCYGYSHQLSGPAGCGGQAAPDWSSEASTVIPTGAAFIDATGPAAYAGHLVFCTYARGMLVVTPGSPHATVTAGASTCNLDVVQGPDHAVYVSDSGNIYRIT
jgi:glucose/arabinose dehydrogenase